MGKRLVEDCLTVDLAWLMRLAPIREGQAGTGEINWRADGDLIGALRFHLDLRATGTARLVLHYNLAATERPREPIRQVIALTVQPQHFGGRRWWMRCPANGDRTRTLHLPPAGNCFASRRALGLTYRVERLNRFDRPFEKLFRAQRRLGNPQRLGAELVKPKGMWQLTFARHAARVAALDVNCAEKIVSFIDCF